MVSRRSVLRSLTLGASLAGAGCSQLDDAPRTYEGRYSTTPSEECQSSPVTSGTQQIIEQGSSDYVIAPPSSPSDPVSVAASELQSYLEQVTGVELPISPGADTDRRLELVIDADISSCSDPRGEDAFGIDRTEETVRLVGGSPWGFSTRYTISSNVMPGSDGSHQGPTARSCRVLTRSLYRFSTERQYPEVLDETEADYGRAMDTETTNRERRNLRAMKAPLRYARLYFEMRDGLETYESDGSRDSLRRAVDAWNEIRSLFRTHDTIDALPSELIEPDGYFTHHSYFEPYMGEIDTTGEEWVVVER